MAILVDVVWRMRHLLQFLLLCLLSMLAGQTRATAAEQRLTIAVAANLQTAFQPLAARFRQQTGIQVDASFGSTGKLSNQIRQGAPFHVLLAADSDYPQQLQQAGLALQAPRPYAIGTLVIWTSRELALDDWPTLLQSPTVRHIAIADPASAPYGREAARALQHFKLLRVLEKKLVYGDSIGQTNQFIVSGAADIGFTAKASVTTVAGAAATPVGHWRELPAESYSPIVQTAVLLKYAGSHQTAAAVQFYQFLFRADARQILQQHGYQLPAP